MYLIVLLLISSAFGRPNSAQVEVGGEIVNKLDSIVHFSNEMGNLLGYYRLIDKVEGIIQIYEYNKTKSNLNHTRQELRDLAETTVMEVRDMTILLEDFDSNNDTDLLKLTVEIMKDLMLETKEKLVEAQKLYRSVFEDLPEGAFFLKYEIDFAINKITVQIDQINNWADSAEDVSENIEDYPAQFLRKYQTIKNVFKIRLHDLKNVTEQFLVDSRSTTFITPSSAQIGVVKKLDSIVSSNNEVGKLMNSSRLLGTDYGELREAEQNILEMETELNTFRNDFNTFNEAKSSLRKTRQELRELARRTVAEGRHITLLLDALPGSGNQVTSLKVPITRLKELMIETHYYLKKAQDRYYSALEAFSSLTSSVGLTNQKLESYLEDKEYTEAVRENCKTASWFTFERCLNVTFERLLLKTDEVFNRTIILNRDIDDAIIVISEEIKLIKNWASTAEIVRENLVLYPEDYLMKFQSIKQIFENGLNELKIVPEKFISNSQTQCCNDTGIVPFLHIYRWVYRS